MNREILTEQANGGDVQAMIQLGRDFASENNFFDAAEWFDKAADTGNVYAIDMAMRVNAVNANMLHTMGLWERSCNTWSKALNYALTILQNRESFDEDTQSLATDNLSESAFNMGLNFYRLKQPNNAIKILKSVIETDERASLLYGICLTDTEEFQTSPKVIAQQAYPHLKLAETSSLNVPEDLLFVSLMLLATFYRSPAISGINGTVEMAYNCVKKATTLSEELAASARQELSKYHKGLFGWTYNG